MSAPGATWLHWLRSTISFTSTFNRMKNIDLRKTVDCDDTLSDNRKGTPLFQKVELRHADTQSGSVYSEGYNCLSSY
jgi:hypothetical protein